MAGQHLLRLFWHECWMMGDYFLFLFLFCFPGLLGVKCIDFKKWYTRDLSGAPRLISCRNNTMVGFQKELRPTGTSFGVAQIRKSRHDSGTAAHFGRSYFGIMDWGFSAKALPAQINFSTEALPLHRGFSSEALPVHGVSQRRPYHYTGIN